ncbi:MAG: PD-(D/E)XK nuclease family protein, partial [Pirellulales bacterium]
MSALENLGKQLGLAPFWCGTPSASGDGRGDDEHGHALRQELRDVPPRNSDTIAWQAIVKHFAALDRLDQALGESPRPLTRRGLLNWLVDLAQHESLPRPFDDSGRVRVLSAATARTIAARHFYLAGMSEQAFPSPERAGLLANDADYRFLAGVADQDFATSVPLASPVQSRSQDEMLLFYEVLTRAEESLTISYPALDDKAQQLPPSPYVTEILRTLGDDARRVKTTQPHLSPIPSANTPLNLNDWRLQAVAQAVGNDRDLRLLAGIFQSNSTSSEPGRPRPRLDMSPALEAGLRITHARQRREDFGPAEGLLSSPAAAAQLARRFGSQHDWSPSQWERYATCPYKFYLEDVLRLRPLGELSLETDFARRGSYLHRVLAEFHRRWLAMPHDSRTAAAEQKAIRQTHFSQVLDAELPTPQPGSYEGALLELDRRQISKWGDAYVDRLADYEALWNVGDPPPTPKHFELRFGPPRRGEAGPVDESSIDTPFLYDIGGETIRVTGRIDRIDVGRIDGRTVFNVIDYKSGKKPALKDDHILSGERLQLPVYCVAAQVVLFGDENAAPLAAGYWTMAAGFDNKGSLQVHQAVDGVLNESDRWKTIEPLIRKRIGELIHNIRAGNFPVFNRDDKCTSTCDFHTTCRIAQIRSLEKTWPPDDKHEGSKAK